MRRLAVITLLFSLSSFTQAATLGITYWGDVRSSLFPSQIKDGSFVDCYLEGTSSPTNCLGGLAQLQGHIKDVQNDFLSGAEKLRIMTGSFVGGETGYLGCPEIGWETSAQMLDGGFFNMTDFQFPDVMSLGMADFDTGLTNLADNYLSKISDNITTLVSNVECSPSCSDFKTIPFVRKPISDSKIGIVGFVNPLANNLSLTGAATFLPPHEAIGKYLDQDVDFYIAVGSGSYEIAKKILATNPKVKLVIYGGGSKDLKDGIEQDQRTGGWIATTGSKYGHYLGALKLTIENKKLTKVEGRKIAVTGDVTDSDVKAKLEATINKSTPSPCFKPLPSEPVAVFQIDGSKCWTDECNLGNLITDAMVHCAYNRSQSPDKPIISVWHGGSMFRDIVKAGEPIKEIDLHKWLPYHNKAYLVRMSGRTLQKLFEISASGLQKDPDWGQFLQISDGVQAFYENNKLVQVRTLHPSTNGIPKFDDIEDDVSYNVVIPTMIYQKRAAWKSLGDMTLIESIGFDDDCLKNYIIGQGKITHGFEERSFFDQDNGFISKCSKKTGLTIFLTLLVTGLIGAIIFAFYRFIIVPRRANNNWFW